MTKFKKKYETQENLLVYPSTMPTIESDTTDGYGGITIYRVNFCDGFKGSHVYTNKDIVIPFVHKNERGKVVSGLQPEQLILICLDRTKKMNEIQPSSENERMIEGLEMYLEAYQDKIDNRINRNA